MRVARAVHDIRDAMQHVVFHTVRPLSLGFGLFIAYTAIREITINERTPIVAADVAVAVYLLGLAAWLWLRPPPMHWMNGLGASVGLALAATDMTTQSVRGAIPGFPATVLVLAGIGAVVLSWRWLLATQGIILAAWVATTQAYTSDPWSAWFIVQITTITGVAIHWGRFRAYTQLIQARNDEAQAKDALQRANQELDRFAAVVAHDLKNPVAAIRLKAGALRYRAPTTDFAQRKTLEELDRVADGMSKMIDDLLSYARAGQVPDRHELVDLNDIARQLRELFDERLRAEGGELSIGALPVIAGEPTQLFQLLENLVGNAISYRRRDAPPLVTLASRARNGGVEITIQDNGQGFDPELAERMFEPFERGDSDAPGHGLGLATCRRIVEQHGGRITARSVPGHGSVFQIWWPDPKDLPRH